MIPDPNQPGVGGHHPTAQEVILGALRDGTVDSREHTLALSERAETAEAERDRLREALTEALSNYDSTWEFNEEHGYNHPAMKYLEVQLDKRWADEARVALTTTEEPNP